MNQCEKCSLNYPDDLKECPVCSIERPENWNESETNADIDYEVFERLFLRAFKFLKLAFLSFLIAVAASFSLSKATEAGTSTGNLLSNFFGAIGVIAFVVLIVFLRIAGRHGRDMCKAMGDPMPAIPFFYNLTLGYCWGYAYRKARTLLKYRELNDRST